MATHRRELISGMATHRRELISGMAAHRREVISGMATNTPVVAGGRDAEVVSREQPPLHHGRRLRVGGGAGGERVEGGWRDTRIEGAIPEAVGEDAVTLVPQVRRDELALRGGARLQPGGTP